MNANNSDIAATISRVFEAVRQTPGAACEPDRMFAYLTEPPATKGRQVRDTFAGRRYFVKFMEALQMEFGVCFTNKEWDRGLGLVDLSKIIEKKVSNPSSQALHSKEKVLEAKSSLFLEPIKFALVFGVILVPIAVLTRSLPISVVCGFIWTLLVAGIAYINLRGFEYSKRLAVRTAELLPQKKKGLRDQDVRE